MIGEYDRLEEALRTVVQTKLERWLLGPVKEVDVGSS